ncbi:DUF2155 domain-containing protein [Pelagibacterales bacterium SAG-MED31]|nr:DUF2155 domain-containing protein [Pelagibacterales bacterium SAG-MED31]
MNLGLLKAFLLLLLLFSSSQSFSIPLQMKYAKFKLLDKISNKLTEKIILVDNSDNVETLNVKVYACFKEPPDEISEDYVLIDVKDNFQDKKNSIYKGWMISSSPEVTPLEHPIYDLWLLGCINDKTS